MWVESLRTPATVIEVARNRRRVVVDAGAFVATVDVDQIGALPEEADGASESAVGAGGREKQSGGGDIRLPRPEAGITDQVDLRGLHVDEALGKLDAFLSEAMLTGLREVRIIHGLGTGRLRAAVQEYLSNSGVVKNFRLGEAGRDPGGPGVTFAELEE